MNIKELIGKTVLDKNANEIGKIEDMKIDTDDFKIETIIINLQKTFMSKENVTINVEDIQTVGQYIILNKEINKEKNKTITAQIIPE